MTIMYNNYFLIKFVTALNRKGGATNLMPRRQQECTTFEKQARSKANCGRSSPCEDKKRARDVDPAFCERELST